MTTGGRLCFLAGCLALCAAGTLFSIRQAINADTTTAQLLAEINPATGYQFASADLAKLSFGKLEAMIRADAAKQFPAARVELGSVKAEHGVLTMTVALFAADQRSYSFVYGLVPHNNSWKIVKRQRLWFVSPSQIARGLRV